MTKEVSETLVIKDKRDKHRERSHSRHHSHSHSRSSHHRHSSSSHLDDDQYEFVRKKSSTRHRSKSPSLLMYLAGGRPS